MHNLSDNQAKIRLLKYVKCHKVTHYDYFSYMNLYKDKKTRNQK